MATARNKQHDISLYQQAREITYAVPKQLLNKTCIYKIVHIPTQRCYVGHTTQGAQWRWYGHLYCLIRGTHLSKYMQNVWNKYGQDEFEFVLIEYCDPKDRLVREQYWIDELDSVFNTAKVAGTTYGTKRTVEVRKKFSEIQTKMQTAQRFLHTEEAQKRHNEVMKTKEYREKMSKVMKGKKKSLETRRRMSETRKRMIEKEGWKMPGWSEESRRKMGASMRGKKKSPEHQAKINASLARVRELKKSLGLKAYDRLPK